MPYSVLSRSASAPPGRRSWWARLRAFPRRHPWATLAGVLLLLIVAGLGAAQRHYGQIVDKRLAGGAFDGTSRIYAAPHLVRVGDPISPAELVRYLERSGYTASKDNELGYFERTPQGYRIISGPRSFFSSSSAEVHFDGGAQPKVTEILTGDGQPARELMIEPEHLSSVSDRTRTKRTFVQFRGIPPVLVQAVTSVEDKRFFDHRGLDTLRLAKAVYINVRENRPEQGGSTLTMQLARSFFLDPEKRVSRKLNEIMISMELERKLDKERIFELYANEVYLGRRGSFNVHGFGEASQAYFGKEMKALTLPEAAMLAGIIQRPSYFNPARYPDRARKRRNLVLLLMRDNGHITEAQYQAAAAAPVAAAPVQLESQDAPYFLDLVNSQLQERLGDAELESKSLVVYSTLDRDLQEDAVAAVDTGMQEIDKQLLRRTRKPRKGEPAPARVLPQVAMVVLDPATGAVRAVIGGRSYAGSQLNRARALRQPGSAFKPFVFAAAFQQAVAKPGTRRRGPVFTPASSMEDVPTTFRFNGQPYQPANFHNQYHGTVTLRQALVKSMNIPTVKLAEGAGFETVATVARQVGLERGLLATPAMALGAYETSPLELAGAYTVFNGGSYHPPYFIEAVRDGDQRRTLAPARSGKPVLDPRVAYLVNNMMEDVLRYGTAAGARSRFTLPAAGKTGTSRDGWFVGYSSKLLCAVWVGYDDGHEFELEGAKSAVPIWAEFMKRAHQRPAYRDAKPFARPQGLVSANVDASTGLLASDSCQARTELFVAGTQPTQYCESDHEEEWVEPSESTEARRPSAGGFFGRIAGVFR